MIRLGLCCKFLREPITFRTTTATSLLKLERQVALQKVSQICLENAMALQKALQYCVDHHIGAFGRRYHRSGSSHLEPRAAFPYFQPAGRLERTKALTPS